MNWRGVAKVLVSVAAMAGSVRVSAAQATAQPPGAITVVQQRGAAREEFPLQMTTDEGVWLGFKTIWSPNRHDDGAGLGAVTGSTVDRVITDAAAGLFFGYRLTTKLTSDHRVRVEFGPLPSDFQLGAHLADSCPGCPPFTPLGAALVRYPDSQLVEDGGAFTLELLRNPKTGEVLSDFVRVRTPKPEAPVTGPVRRVTTTSAPSERFRVDLALRWDISSRETLLADIHVVDLRTGKEATRALLPMARPEDSGQLRFGGWTTKNVAFEALLQVQASRSAGTVVYTVEVREGDEIVHAEKVSFPFPSR